jgi:hypothetical protein
MLKVCYGIILITWLQRVCIDQDYVGSVLGLGTIAKSESCYSIHWRAGGQV